MNDKSNLLIGVDEVGRGCWAGPVVAAAVILPHVHTIIGLNDSKKLNAQTRTRLAEQIKVEAIGYGIGWVWPEYVDEHGLTASVGAAMALAADQVLQSIGKHKVSIMIDGSYNFLQNFEHVTTMVKADATVPAVSAASILAKVARDDYMQRVASIEYPGYGFENHVGYGTPQHIVALKQLGICSIHRRSYKPIMALLG